MNERDSMRSYAWVAVLIAAMVGPTLLATAAPPADPVPGEAGPDIEAGPVDPSPAEPRWTRGSRTTLGGSVTIPADTVHRGEVVVIGGSVVVDGTVTREVVVIGGDAEINGNVDGDLVGVVSTLKVAPGVRIGGSLVNVGGVLENGGAEVGRDFVDMGIGLRIPGGLSTPFNLLAILVNWGMLIKLALLFLVIVLLAALVPERIDRLGEEPPARMLLALLVGALFAIVGFPILILLLAVSVIGILLIPVVILLYVVLGWLGMAGVFRAFGRELGRLAGREMSLLGSVLLGFGVFAVLHGLPYLSGLVWGGFSWLALAFLALLWTVLGWIGIGLILITRVGGPPRPVPAPVVPPTTPVAPSPPSTEPVAPPTSGSSPPPAGPGHPPPE